MGEDFEALIIVADTDSHDRLQQGLLTPDMSVVAEQSASYKRGFKQVRQSGYAAGGYLLVSFTRDTQYAETDGKYRPGWKKG